MKFILTNKNEIDVSYVTLNIRIHFSVKGIYFVVMSQS